MPNVPKFTQGLWADPHCNISISSGSGHWCSEPWIRRLKWAFPAQIWLDIILISILGFILTLLHLPYVILNPMLVIPVWPPDFNFTFITWSFYVSFFIQTTFQQSKTKLRKVAWGLPSLLFAKPLHGESCENQCPLPTNSLFTRVNTTSPLSTYQHRHALLCPLQENSDY